jgi:hypothetical protein
MSSSSSSSSSMMIISNMFTIAITIMTWWGLKNMIIYAEVQHAKLTEVGVQCLVKNLHYLNMALTLVQKHPKILVQ